MSLSTQLYANNAKTILLTELLVSDTTINVVNGSQFPAPSSAGDYFLVTLEYQNTIEIIRVGARNGNILSNCVRGQEGTLARGFLIGSRIELRDTRDSLNAFAHKDGVMAYIQSVDLLDTPVNSNSRSYLCDSKDDFGNPITVFKSSPSLWRFGTHSIVSVADNAASSTSTSVSSTNISGSGLTVIPGRYIIQFITGVNAGACRVITQSTSNTVVWGTPLLNSTQVGDQFEIYKSDAYILSIGNSSSTGIPGAVTDNLPTVKPNLLFDFAKSVRVDPRISVTRASPATYYDNRGVLRTAAVNVPRIDYNPSTNECLGLFVEPAKTNIRINSNDVAVTNIDKLSVPSVLAPDGGSSTIYRPSITSGVHSTSSASHDISGLATNGTLTVTQSVFVKATGVDDIQIKFVMSHVYGGITSTRTIIFDPNSNTVSALASGQGFSNTTSKIEVLQRGWTRVSITTNFTKSSNSTSLSSNLVILKGLTDTYTGNGTEGVYLYGFQDETGQVSSYISTSGSPVTRSTDFVTLSGTSLSNAYRIEEGTFFVLVNSKYGNQNPYAMSLDDGTTSNRISIGLTSSGFVTEVVKAGVATNPDTLGVRVDGIFAAVSIGFKAGRAVASANGFPVGVATPTTIPSSPTTLRIGGISTTGANSLEGWVSKLAYYPHCLRDIELQSITM